MGTLEILVHGRSRIAEGNETTEEFPKVFFTVSDDIASCKGSAGRISGHDPVEAPHSLQYEYKEHVS
jgi:hypothetical protein